ncbi:MAG: DNA repair protein RecO C-terminal domain-containing protein [Holosporales bacterium]|jgi:DNA repair protein RecO (recombination protein O)|nr:DNA repair protein RecO C-terminal domain-containing protein [Holosporales bacterium]
MAVERHDAVILLEKHFYGEHRCHGIFLTQAYGCMRVNLPKRKSLSLQPGDFGQLRWKTHSTERLAFGSYEGETSPISTIFHNPCALIALKSACTLCVRVLPEHAPAEPMFRALIRLLKEMSVFHPALYVRFECEALFHIGYGLDLTRCAVTGAFSELRFVSPKTGCAVSEKGAGSYREKLLKLPIFLRDPSIKLEDISSEDIRQGLRLTEHFWNRALRALHPTHLLPPERILLEQYL